MTLPGSGLAAGSEFVLRTRSVATPTDNTLEGLYFDYTPAGAPRTIITQCQQYGYEPPRARARSSVPSSPLCFPGSLNALRAGCDAAGAAAAPPPSRRARGVAFSASFRAWTR